MNFRFKDISYSILINSFFVGTSTKHFKGSKYELVLK